MKTPLVKFNSILYQQADGYQKTGCYNLQCPGFVQVHPRLLLGIPYDKSSILGGQQYITDLMINQVVQTHSVLNFAYKLLQYIIIFYIDD